MQLECPICRSGNAVAPPNSPGADVRLTCVHCGAALRLDTFAGRLAPDKGGVASEPVAEAPEATPHRRTEGFFHPRLSEGRDNLSILFVIVCLAVIALGGLRLVLTVPSTPASWPLLDPRALFERVESLAGRILSGGSSQEKDTPKRHLARGKRLVREERYAQGLRELDAAIAIDAENFESHFWRGRALVKLNRETEAIAAFEAAVTLNPRYSYAHDNLGWIYLRRKDYPTSLEYLDRSLALRPDNAWAYYNRGRVHFQLGQEEKAFQDAEAACRLGFEAACDILKRYGRDAGS